MNSDDAVLRACNLPSGYRTGNISPYEFLRESGIERQSLTAKEVLPFLIESPNLVDDWIGYSQDQRGSPAYFILEENGIYVVGLNTGDYRVEYEDRNVACANFVAKAVNMIW